MAQTANRVAVATKPNDRTQALVGACCAAFFGLVLIAGAAFAGPDEIHNAAHDSRHAFAFPCH